MEGNPVEAYFNRYYQMIVAPYYYSMWIDGNGLGTATRAELLLQEDGERKIRPDQSLKMELP